MSVSVLLPALTSDSEPEIELEKARSPAAVSKPNPPALTFPVASMATTVGSDTVLVTMSTAPGATTNRPGVPEPGRAAGPSIRRVPLDTVVRPS